MDQPTSLDGQDQDKLVALMDLKAESDAAIGALKTARMGLTDSEVEPYYTEAIRALRDRRGQLRTRCYMIIRGASE